ncbi:UNVERIFIED_CONTAM: hypothetical protein GTU68_021919 [Idotea baltica]|nr:hypothetical protein [Idotea baltica]
MTTRERFAPSPTGLLHLGHAYSALTAYEHACQSQGEFILRIEDIDQTRCKSQFEAAIYQDLAWLGINWTTPVLRQSPRTEIYHDAIQSLWDRGLIYVCNCSRKDIALAAPQEDGEPLLGPDGIIYPGTCRDKSQTQIAQNTTLRLHMKRAVSELKETQFTFDELGSGPHGETGQIQFTSDHLITEIGDIVLARKDIATSYHLAVVIDDAYQNITHVTRGNDLFDATKIHVVLQKLLGFDTPKYRHHRLIRDENGKRLAKRYDAMAIQLYRENGYTPETLRQLIEQNGMSPFRSNIQ